MALNRSNKYPGRFLSPTTLHPQGAFKNRTSPTSQDGSYLEADWMNDIDGFFARALNIANVTPNGNVDDGSSSQLFDAVVAATPGRLLDVKTITSTTVYVPTTGTKTLIVELIGGGGGGGSNAATINSGVSVAGGGAAGTYAVAKMAAGSYVANVGTAGVGASPSTNGLAGGAGGATTFNGVTAPGGPGGPGGNVITALPQHGDIGSAGSAATGPGILFSKMGETGERSLALNSLYVLAGGGGHSIYGTGSPGRGIKMTPNAATGFDAIGGYGAGGGGACSITGSAGVSSKGGNGTGGIIIVWEYA